MPQGSSTIRAEAPAQRRGRALAAASLAALALAGCSVDRAATASIPAADYRETHPIQIVERPTSLDIYPSGGRMDRATQLRLKQFGQSYRNDGVGPLSLLVPQGAANEGALRAAVPQVRDALAAGGAHGSLSVGSYPANPQDSAPPMRLVYRALRAQTPHRCGEWPDDLASADSIRGWENRPYWNYGCASQAALAAQVADPRDFAEPRAEAPVDVEMRRRAIEKVRAGADPGSTWRTRNSDIGGVGN